MAFPRGNEKLAGTVERTVCDRRADQMDFHAIASGLISPLDYSWNREMDNMVLNAYKYPITRN